MGDCGATVPVLEEEENLIASVQHIVEVLGRNKNLSHNARKILADLGSQLSSLTRVCENEDERVDETEEKFKELEELLNLVQNKVTNWEVDQPIIWDCGQEEAYEYLRSVNDVRKLTERLETIGVDKDSKEDELLRRAQDVQQTAMNRLEEEFSHLLVQNRQPIEPEHLSFRSCEEDIVDEDFSASFGDDSVEDVVRRDSMSRGSEEYIIPLVHPDVIPYLRCIANLMFNSNYGRECSQAFTSVRKDALDDFLYILELEKLSIEDVLKMEWKSLNSKIRRWIRGMKIFVRKYLASEKWLSDQIFGELDSVSSDCFAESSKASMSLLLNFGEAIAIGPHQPEKLNRILDMYEVLSDLIPDIDTMYSDESGLCVKTECQDILGSLGDCARTTFLEFENAVATSVSANAFSGGGIHPITKWVMNYMKTLIDYSKTLNKLLRGHEEEDSVTISPDMTPDREEENAKRSCYLSPLAQQFRSLTSILECNLDDKSKLYKDESLGHLFLMNNIHYMAEKVKNTNLRTLLGDDWIRKHNWKFQHHAMSYERATWSPIISLLRDEGLRNPGSNSISKTLLKERLHSFYLAFDDIYKNQTAWSIPDIQLRDDLRISTSLKIIQAYRTFIGRHTNHISEKYIKYSADDLENYLLDLFEGSPRSLHGSSHRR